VWCKLGILYYTANQGFQYIYENYNLMMMKVLSRSLSVKRERMYAESMIYCDEKVTCTYVNAVGVIKYINE
jgi:hypothetical protein